MHRKLLLTAALLCSLVACRAQNLTNDQLLKIYGILLNGIEQPRSRMMPYIVREINLNLSIIDRKWSTNDQKDVMYGDNEVFIDWSYRQTAANVQNVQIAIKTVQLQLFPDVSYIAPYPEIFYRNLADMAKRGKFIGQSKNELKGVDKKYSLGNIIFVYSTFPNDGKINDKLTTLYKIDILGAQ